MVRCASSSRISEEVRRALSHRPRHTPAMVFRRLILAFFLVAAAPALAAPEAELWERWTAHNPGSSITVDHQAWDRLLRVYAVPGADGVNRFAYGRVSDADPAALAAYIDALAATPVSRFRRDEQIAYWVNLYNALTVKVVLDHYPVDSIKDIDISPGLFANGPWGEKLVEVEGVAVSLDDIEHRILRPIWKDPRIHYVVTCAAVGCPHLRTMAFTAENWDRAFAKAAVEFINHPRGVSVEGDTLVVSSIYDWYGADFGGTDAAIIEHLKTYAEPALREKLNRFSGIDDDEYDWSLNVAR